VDVDEHALLAAVAGEQRLDDVDGRAVVHSQRRGHEPRHVHGTTPTEHRRTFTANSNATLDAYDAIAANGTNAFNNAGAFVKQGTGTTQFRSLLSNSPLPFNNAGTVDIQQGTLSLQNGGTHTGDFSIASGALLELQGTHSFAATSDLTGAGTLSVLSGTANVAGTLSAAGSIDVNGGGAINVNSTATTKT